VELLALNMEYGCMDACRDRGMVFSMPVTAGMLQEANMEMPTVTIEYDHLTVAADALLGAAGIPSLWNVAKHFIMVCTAVPVRKLQTHFANRPRVSVCLLCQFFAPTFINPGVCLSNCLHICMSLANSISL
jgi:hypothetical protein